MSLVTEPLRGLARAGAGGIMLPLAGVVALLYFGRLFLITLFCATALSFILEPLVALLVRVRLPRSLASFLVCGLAGLLLYLMGFGLYNQMASLVEDVPQYVQRIEQMTGAVASRFDAAERSVRDLLTPKRQAERERQAQQQSKAPPARKRRGAEPAAVPAAPPAIPEVRIHPERSPVLDFLFSHLGSLSQVVVMASFIPFLVFFMLSWRERLRRRFLQLFDDEDVAAADSALEGIGAVVRVFVVGNFVLGAMLAGASAIAFAMLDVPYPFLTGAVSGLFSLVPYFGLPLAILPPVLSALAVTGKLTVYLAIAGTVAAFHLVTMNLLYPKFVGKRVHLNPLVVTIALMLWGQLWGPAGIVLAIPVTAGMKAVFDNVPRLQPYGKLLGD